MDVTQTQIADALAQTAGGLDMWHKTVVVKSSDIDATTRMFEAAQDAGPETDATGARAVALQRTDPSKLAVPPKAAWDTRPSMTSRWMQCRVEARAAQLSPDWQCLPYAALIPSSTSRVDGPGPIETAACDAVQCMRDAQAKCIRRRESTFTSITVRPDWQQKWAAHFSRQPAT